MAEISESFLIDLLEGPPAEGAPINAYKTEIARGAARGRVAAFDCAVCTSRSSWRLSAANTSDRSLLLASSSNARSKTKPPGAGIIKLLNPPVGDPLAGKDDKSGFQ